MGPKFELLKTLGHTFQLTYKILIWWPCSPYHLSTPILSIGPNIIVSNGFETRVKSIRQRQLGPKWSHVVHFWDCQKWCGCFGNSSEISFMLECLKIGKMMTLKNRSNKMSPFALGDVSFGWMAMMWLEGYSNNHLALALVSSLHNVSAYWATIGRDWSHSWLAVSQIHISCLQHSKDWFVHSASMMMSGWGGRCW